MYWHRAIFCFLVREKAYLHWEKALFQLFQHLPTLNLICCEIWRNRSHHNQIRINLHQFFRVVQNLVYKQEIRIPRCSDFLESLSSPLLSRSFGQSPQYHLLSPSASQSKVLILKAYFLLDFDVYSLLLFRKSRFTDEREAWTFFSKERGTRHCSPILFRSSLFYSNAVCWNWRVAVFMC